MSSLSVSSVRSLCHLDGINIELNIIMTATIYKLGVRVQFAYILHALFPAVSDKLKVLREDGNFDVGLFDKSAKASSRGVQGRYFHNWLYLLRWIGDIIHK